MTTERAIEGSTNETTVIPAGVCQTCRRYPCECVQFDFEKMKKDFVKDVRKKPVFSHRYNEQRGEMKEYKNHWVLRYYVTDSTGKRVKIAEPVPLKELSLGADIMEEEFYRRRRMEVVNREQRRLVAESRGDKLTAMSVGTFRQRYWEPHIRRELRASTAKSYRLSWGTYCNELDDKPLVTFSPSDATALLVKLRDEKQLGRATIARIKVVLSSLFGLASDSTQAEQFIPVNPIKAVKVKVAKAPKVAEQYSIEERDAILALKDVSIEAKALLALCCVAGCRPGEAAGLEWDRVDFKGLTIHLTKAVTGGVLGEMKTEWSKRRVAITEPLTTWLKKWHAECGKPTSGLVFKTKTGRVIEASAYFVYYTKWAVEQWNKQNPSKRIEWKPLYAGRHHFHKMIWDATHDIVLVTKLSGNRDMTAFKHYLRASEEEAIAAQRALEKAQNGKRKARKQ